MEDNSKPLHSSKDLSILIEELRLFRDNRGWKTNHNPKNLAVSVVIEASELLEHFQWKSEKESRYLSQSEENKVIEEMADVFIYLLYLSEELNVDLVSAAFNKMNKNSLRYPAENSSYKLKNKQTSSINKIDEKSIIPTNQLSIYNEYSEYFDSLIEYSDSENEIKFLKEFIQTNFVKPKILECGCTTGRLTIPLFLNDFNVTGLDSIESMIILAKEKNSGIHFILADFSSIPLNNESFDVVFCGQGTINRLINEKNLVGFFDEVFRILKTNGKLIIIEDCKTQRKFDYNKSFENEFIQINIKISSKINSGLILKNYNYLIQDKKSNKSKNIQENTIEKIWGLKEIQSLLELSGLEIEKTFGEFVLNKSFESKNENLIIIAKKTLN